MTKDPSFFDDRASDGSTAKESAGSISKPRRSTSRRVFEELQPHSIASFRDVLDQAEPRPNDKDSDAKAKKNYAERLSNKLAVLVANKLRDTGDFTGVLPNADGTGRESSAATGANKKLKKTDVRFSTFDTGLELLVSIKTYSFRDWRKDRRTGQIVLGRYTKNMVRNDHELRAEAMDHHERHPYAVLAAMFFLPIRACDDAGTDKSSFAHAVMTFRQRCGRSLPTDPHQLFERLFIGLYELDGDQRGDVWFFDVMDKPPRRGRPSRQDPKPGEIRRGLLTLEETIAEIVKAYGIRNRRYIEWADEDPNAAPDLVPPADLDTEEDEAE